MSARMKKEFLLLLVFAVGLLFPLGCDNSSSSQPNDRVKPGTSSIEARKKAKKKKKPTGLIEKKPSDKDRPRIAFEKLKETDFIKAPRRRDPFEPFIELLTKKDDSKKLIQRNVKLKEYDIADLKLIGIITNIGDPRAMVVVPNGTGFVLKRGDYVGRADYVQQGTRGEQIQVNWRVARIHGSGKEEERGIYFVRDDPTTTKGVDVTRFLSLHPNH